MRSILLSIGGAVLLAAGCSATTTDSPVVDTNTHEMHHGDGPSQSTNVQYDRTVTGLEPSIPRETIVLQDGDTYSMAASYISHDISGNPVRMLAYNGMIPGPTLQVAQGTTITIPFTNNTDIATTVHWHGLRVDFHSDGLSGVSQDPIAPGESFTYTLTFPDTGVFWYHPHIEEDYGQELGLYGAIVVDARDPSYWQPVNQAETVFLDDVLMAGDDIAPFTKDGTSYALMGRYGSTMLINGVSNTDTAIATSNAGAVVRFAFINAANTRTFNISIPNATMHLVGSDGGAYEHERAVTSITIAPSERFIVDAYFEQAGTYTLTHTTPDMTYSLSTITITENPVEVSHRDVFHTLSTNTTDQAAFAHARSLRTAEPDKTINLVHTGQSMGMMHANQSSDGIEWEDTMTMMNQGATSVNTAWKLQEASPSTWEFEQGTWAKVRIINSTDGSHPMQHPIHLHGQRFLVLEENGTENTNMVWKDTVLVPTGTTTDILIEMSNPGSWMMHCHIAEHLEAGMFIMFDVVAPQIP